MNIYQKIILLLANGGRERAIKFIQPAYQQNKITEEQYNFLIDITRQEVNDDA